MNLSKFPIKGSNRPEIADSEKLGLADQQQIIKVSIYARRNPYPNPELLARVKMLTTQLPRERKYFNQKEFDEAFGASPDELKKIVEWATLNKLNVIEQNVSQKRVKVEGSIGDISTAFNVSLNEYQHPTLGKYRGRSGHIFAPYELHSIIKGVFGLDTRPVGEQTSSHGRFASIPWEKLVVVQPNVSNLVGLPSNPYPGTFYPPQVAALYNYPKGFDGTGQRIAVFAFNGDPNDPHGGYSLAALKNYYHDTLGQKVPNITDVVIQGPGNDPGPGATNWDSTGEVYLDMCIVGSLLPGADIYVYFSEFTSQGWVDALHDAIAGGNDIDVISISYGNPEKDQNSAWTDMAINVVNEALEAAQSKGITICCSSGDNGSIGGVGQAEVEFPASSPYVLSVGGTTLVASGSLSTIIREMVWRNARQDDGSGGGISIVFSKPAYQDNVSVPPSVNPPHAIGRGVPDVAAVGDPNTGVMVMQPDGNTIAPVGGTSASAPLWASLIIMLNQALGANCGFINTVLYNKCETGVLNDITKGNNGAYSAVPGWDACTGLGSPNGEKLLEAFK